MYEDIVGLFNVGNVTQFSMIFYYWESNNKNKIIYVTWLMHIFQNYGKCIDSRKTCTFCMPVILLYDDFWKSIRGVTLEHHLSCRLGFPLSQMLIFDFIPLKPIFLEKTLTDRPQFGKFWSDFCTIEIIVLKKVIPCRFSMFWRY